MQLACSFRMNEYVVEKVSPVYPDAVVLVSGKRKSGKDYIATRLQQQLLDHFEHAVGGKSAGGAGTAKLFIHIIHVAEPIKREWAQRYGLDLGQLMDSSAVKEKYRREMVAWGNEQRERDPDIFCRLATEPLLLQPVSYPADSLQKSLTAWILADARQETDLEHFIRNYTRRRCTTVRVVADEQTRTARGWQFVAGIDDAVTECGLDAHADWDFVITNDNNTSDMEIQAKRLMQHVVDCMHFQ